MKKVSYPNLNDYDLSAYEELKGDVLYWINGGTGAMTEADQAAMAEACKNGDKDKQAEILSKYEKKDDATTTPTNNMVLVLDDVRYTDQQQYADDSSNNKYSTCHEYNYHSDYK